MSLSIYRRILFLIFVLGLYASNIASADIFSANPNNYRTLLGNLSAGDTLLLEAGLYTDGLDLRGLQGENGNVITISGPDTGDAAIFYSRSCCNTIQLGNTSYVTIRHLTVDGQNIDYIDAVNTSDVTHHITVEHLLIINHGGSSGPNTDSQATIGISTKAPAWDWIIRYNTIIEAGTGMYLGNSNGAYPFVRGIIEYNLIFDTLGYNIEIKHQNPRPTGIGLPTGNNKTIIRHNVFSKANNYSSGALARPNLLVGHWPLSGSGSNDIYEIYGNFFYQNPSEVLFQGEGNFALYNNVLINDAGRTIHIAPHNDVPKNIAVFFNTVVSSERGINVSNPNTNYTQFVIGNAIFSSIPISAPSTVTQIANVTDTYANSVNYLTNPTSMEPLNPYPVAGMLSGDSINSTSLQNYSDWNKDFNGDVRNNTFRGAYSGEGTNPGWLPTREIKSTVSDDNIPPTSDPDTDSTLTPNTDNLTSADEGTGAFSSLEMIIMIIFGLQALFLNVSIRRLQPFLK